MAKVCREAGISRVLFYRWLKRYKKEGIVAPKKKKTKSELSVAKEKKSKKRKKPSKSFELTPQQRLMAIKRIVEDGEPVAKVSRDYQVSRPTLYKWLKRYQKSSEDKKISSLFDKKARVRRYYRQTPEKYEEAVLSLVALYPQLGVAKIVKALPKIGNKPIVGHHGVQNILRRHDLNTYEKRLVYAESQKSPFTEVFALLKDFGIRFITLPTQIRVSLIRSAFIIFTTAFLTILILGGLSYWASLMSGTPLNFKIGLFLSTLSLGTGMIFFAYSMKYYLTLALVLSFSREPLEEDGLKISLSVQSRQNGQGGWLKKIFGINKGSSLKNKGISPAGGLHPSLDHIRLKRKPFVSIHLPFYNEKKVAKRILTACTNMDYYEGGQARFEVIVCDDSTDETVRIVHRFAKNWNKKNPYGPKVKVVHRPTREGFKGAALGYALKKVNPQTEFIVVFDADFVPYPDTLEVFVKYYKATGTFTGPKDSLNQASKVAAVTGYQWHVLNKSENWITRGVRTEYAGSYVIERPGREILGLLKQIHGSVYMIRRDYLEKVGWGTSITEDFQLTLKLYEAGYKVVYTPYVQAPAECVSTLKRLIRQRMRWAEGHSNCIKKKFWSLLTSPHLSFMEKLEVVYLTPYYLQAFFFLIGTLAWLLSETVFPVRLPFWTELWGWSLVLTNFFALPLMNSVGMFLEEAEERDYLGIFSFMALCYLLVPFQAYAAVKGFVRKDEGPWFRTPKTGKVTDIFRRGSFYRWIAGILPRPGLSVTNSLRAPVVSLSGKPASSLGSLRNLRDSLRNQENPYLAMVTANNRFNLFQVSRKRRRWPGRIILTVLIIFSMVVFSLAPLIPTESLVQAVSLTYQPEKTNVIEGIREIPNAEEVDFKDKKVKFAFTDDNSDETLIIKADRKTYVGLVEAEVYFSVTNTSNQEEKVNFQVYFPQEKGEVKKIEKWQDNWQELGAQTEPLAEEQGIFEKAKEKRKAISSKFKVKKRTIDNGLVIGLSQTAYFKMQIAYPPQTSGEFFIEAIGDKGGYGLLDPWWNSDWGYKKPITISYSGSTLSDFQILVTADTETLIDNSKMQSDCGDIRMIDSNEGVGDELDYWIESGTCDSDSTRIWVEVDSITNGGKTIYMYYGKADAPNASNGPNTFVYFNDFETSVGFDAGLLNPTQTTGSAKYDTYGIYGAGGAGYRQETRDGINSGRDLIWETWVRGKSSSSNCSLSGIGIGHPGGGTDKNGYQAYIDERNLVGIRLNFSSSNVICSDSATVSFDTWYFISAYWTSDDELGVSLYTDPSLSAIGSCNTTNTTYSNGEYGVAAYKNADWDDYRVRKYASSEPTTEVGNEVEYAATLVEAFGSQTASLIISSSNQHIGGGFSILSNSGSRNVTGITITENGTVDAQNDLDNIKLYYESDTDPPYDCVDESYANGTDGQFGSTDTDGFSGANGTSAFSGSSVGISTTSTMCVYVVLDVGSDASNNETLEIKIDDPSTEVTVSSGSVTPDSAVEIFGTTTLLTPADLDQIHYRWRNDDAGEASSWWDPDWDYRKKVTITGQSGAGTNYQAELMVGESSGSSGDDFHLEGHGQDDFDDLRFVDDDDSTELDYWIKEISGTTPNQTAIVWVEVQDDLGSNVDVYAYYGNDSAEEVSSGTDTFMFFDDFNDGDATGWTEHNGTWTVTDFDGSYRYYQSANTGDYLRTSNGTPSWTDYVLETRIRIAAGGATGGFAGVLLRFQDTDNHYATILDDRDDDSIWARRWVNGSYDETSEWTDVSIDRDTWHDLKVEIFDDGADETLKSTFNGYTHEYDYDDFATGKIALMMHGTQAYYDDIRVRKYAATEPDFSSAGSEEEPESGATWAKDQDMKFEDFPYETLYRLRFEVSNEGGQSSGSVTYQLQVAETGTCASGSYAAVPTDTSGDWQIVGSTYITDGESTQNVSSGLDDEATTFVAGQLKDTGNTTSAITLNSDEFTEIEFAVQATTNATNGGNYCFRLYDTIADEALDTYTKYPEAVLVPENLWPVAIINFLGLGWLRKQRKFKKTIFNR